MIDPTNICVSGNPLSALHTTASQDAGMYTFLTGNHKLNSRLASTLFLDMSTLLNLINPIPAAHSFRDPRMPDIPMIGEETSRSPEKTLSGKKRPRRLRFLKSLVSSLHTFGLCATTDKICKEDLKIEESKALVGTIG